MKPSRQFGFSLIELLLVIALLAALAVAAFIIYPNVQVSRQAHAESTHLVSIKANAKSLFRTNYFGINNLVSIQGSLIPEPLITDPVGGVLRNSWGTGITITNSDNVGVYDNTNPAQYFRIIYSSVPSEACIKLAAATSKNFGAVFISDVGVASVPTDAIVNTYTGVLFNPAGVPDACTRSGAADAARMMFVSN